jgi:Ca2+-binding RTX toxin-like protein
MHRIGRLAVFAVFLSLAGLLLVATHAAEATPRDCTITGTTGDDVLTGTPGRDVICGLAGNDTISGGDGDDIIRGGPGADIVSGGAGNDLLNVRDRRPGDKVDGGPGIDRCRTDRGDSRVGCEVR